MTTQPAPAPDNSIAPHTLPPEDRAYGDRLERALRCGVPGCLCVNPGRFHCPSHDNAEVPTLTVSYDSDRGFSFACTRCPHFRVMDALAKRGLMPESHLLRSTRVSTPGVPNGPGAWYWSLPKQAVMNRNETE